MELSDKFEDSYSRYRGGRLSLSFPLHQERDDEVSESTTFAIATHSSLSISTDVWRQTMMTDAWRLRRTNDAPLLAPSYFRFGKYSRVSGALRMVQRPAWQELFISDFKLRFDKYKTSLLARHRWEQNSVHAWKIRDFNSTS